MFNLLLTRHSACRLRRVSLKTAEFSEPAQGRHDHTFCPRLEVSLYDGSMRQSDAMVQGPLLMHSYGGLDKTLSNVTQGSSQQVIVDGGPVA